MAASKLFDLSPVPSPRPVPAPLQPVIRETSRPLVLVVDDDPVMRIYANDQLAGAGFAVQLVEDGPAAVVAVRDLSPDLIILDVQMPGIDGYETCRSLRDTPEGRHTPILMLTALDDLESIQRAFEAGATDFASKPANWALLAHRLEYILRSSRSAAELRDSRARLANAQRIAKLGYWEWDLGKSEFVASDQFVDIFGPSAGGRAPLLHTFLEQIHREDRETVWQAIRGVVDRGESSDIEFRLRRADGEERFVRQRAELTEERKNGRQRVVASVQDTTDQKRAENRARFLARYDGLTRLPNRHSFVTRLSKGLASARRLDRRMALFFIDLDRFNRVNDTLGRELGDYALQQVADRLRSFVRCSDVLGQPGGQDMVARFGGDEFALLVSDLAEPRDAAGIARRLAAVLSQPLSLGESEVVITASVGISLFPGDGEDTETLMGCAETAMYDTKNRGGDNYQYYSRQMNENTAERLALETDLNTALQRREFVLHYQPQYDVESGRIVGAEALVRWQHPRHGLVSPAKFIPLAEETGSIIAIGDWVLRTACAQAKAWQRAGYGDLKVSVNVSGRQLERPDFSQIVEQALTAADLEPSLLNLELTESFLLEDVERAIRSLESLKSIGTGLSLDDFGTGFSSLSYLMRLPFDTIKIDRSFLKGVPAVSEHRAITGAILALARSIGMRVVAEGVETREQHEFLRQRGCDALQGFLFSKPLPVAELEGLLERPQEQPTTLAPRVPLRPLELVADHG